MHLFFKFWLLLTHVKCFDQKRIHLKTLFRGNICFHISMDNRQSRINVNDSNTIMTEQRNQFNK